MGQAVTVRIQTQDKLNHDHNSNLSYLPRKHSFAIELIIHYWHLESVTGDLLHPHEVVIRFLSWWPKNTLDAHQLK